MIPRFSLCLALVCSFVPGLVRAADAIAVPSGQEVTFLDTIWNEAGPAGLTVRFRFLAPAIAAGEGTVSAEAVTVDMEALCNTYAIPRLDPGAPKPAQIVISLSDRPVAFGEADPEATQYFEAYKIVDDTCEWELF